MIVFLLKYWQALAATLLTSIIAIYLHTISLSFERSKIEKEASYQVEAVNKKCTDDKLITEKVSHEYQDKIESLRARLVSAKRMYEHSCIVVTDATGRRNGEAKSGKLAGKSYQGSSYISGEKFLDLIGEGEKYRLQLISCQDFINRSWKR